MTNKTNNKKKVNFQKPKQKTKKKTPFADTGEIIGSKVSSMFGVPWAKGIGKWLGSGIGQIFGSGDYTMVGASPDYNVLTNGNQIPKFGTQSQTNVICHREYLGDVYGTSAFKNNTYPLNPGSSKTFPWLSSVAQNYQQYKFHGLIFEFRSLMTDFVTGGQPGVVVMATNYNSDSLAYTTKQDMENSEYAVSIKPTRDLIHGVECATNQTVLSQLYVRTGQPPAGQDLRLYDLGLFQLATQANPAAVVIGELWVSYCVEFFKPVLPTDVGGNVTSNHTVRTSTTSASPFGTIQTSSDGDLDVAVIASNITVNSQPGNYYLVTISWTGSVAAAIVYPTFTYSSCTQVGFWTPGDATQLTTPGAATTSTSMCYQTLVQATDTLFLITASIGTATLPSGSTTCDIVVSSYSTEAI